MLATLVLFIQFNCFIVLSLIFDVILVTICQIDIIRVVCFCFVSRFIVIVNFLLSIIFFFERIVSSIYFRTDPWSLLKFSIFALLFDNQFNLYISQILRIKKKRFCQIFGLLFDQHMMLLVTWENQMDFFWYGTHSSSLVLINIHTSLQNFWIIIK